MDKLLETIPEHNPNPPNCKCRLKRPEGGYYIGKHEGRYRICKRCKGKVWD